MQTGQMPELVRRKGEMKVDGGVLPGNGAIICIIAKLCVFLGTQLQKIHSFTSFGNRAIKNAEVRQRTPAAHFLSTAGCCLSQVVESVQPPVRSSMQSPLDRHGISLLQTNTQVVCF
jgi:hypothetical protein